MSVPALITVPSSSCYASVIITMERVVGVTGSPYSLQEQSFKWPGERWSLDLRMPPMTDRSVAAEWQSFMMKLEGRFNVFLMGDPSAKTPRGVATGTPLVDGANQVGTTLATKGWSNSITNIMRAGDYIQLGTGLTARLHMVVEDVNSDGSGNCNLKIYPALRESPANNAAIVTNDAKGVFRLMEDAFSWSVDPGPVYRMSFNAIEVV